MTDRDLKPSPERFESNLNELAAFVDDSYEGWTREVFSDPYAASREFIAQKMREAGLEVRTDDGGNIIGKLPGLASGRGQSLKPLMTGSHTDTVRNGGRFDGVVGLFGSLEVVDALREQAIRLEHDLYVVDFLGEEPNEFGISCMGSRAMAGVLRPEHLGLSGASGQKLSDALRAFGVDPEAAIKSSWGPNSLHAYVELHIEQGPALERKNKQIGVVTAIAGINRLMARFVGEPDHAGATPMDSRHDALTCAAETILAVERVGCGAPVHGVATTGRIESYPGSFNVVPSEARIYAELRSVDADWLHGAKRDVAEQIAAEADHRGVSQIIEWLTDQEPVPTTPALRDYIADVSDSLGYSWMAVPSGAGHDAAHMANMGPMGMIFVPSVGGHSHRPDEFTATPDIAVGIHTLAETLKRLDQVDVVTA